MRLALNGSSTPRRLFMVSNLLICLCLFFTSCHHASAGSKIENTPDNGIASRAAIILTVVQRDSNVTDAELDAARPFVEEYCSSSFSDKTLERTLSKVHKLGCGEECFSEAVISMRRAVESGKTAKQAGQLVVKSAEEVKKWCTENKIPLDNYTFAARLKIRFDSYLAGK